MTEAVIYAQNLRKSYGNKTALNGVDLTVGQGRIVGLVGPNGAGKTTLLKGILGLAPVDGTLSVLGLNPRTDRTRLMEQVSFTADTAIMPRWLKVNEALDYLSQVHPRFQRHRAEHFLAQTNISHEQQVRQLSKGMLTQLHLALIMAIDSKLLVLDEPTLGLDILYRKQFFTALLDDYFDEGKTILVTTHQIEEVENILTDVVFIRDGQVCLDLPMESIEERFSELLVGHDQIEDALKFSPIYSRTVLGGKAMIFDGVARAQLEVLGDVNTPSLADLFVAKFQEATGPLKQEEISHA